MHKRVLHMYVVLPVAILTLQVAVRNVRKDVMKKIDKYGDAFSKVCVCVCTMCVCVRGCLCLLVRALV